MWYVGQTPHNWSHSILLYWCRCDAYRQGLTVLERLAKQSQSDPPPDAKPVEPPLQSEAARATTPISRC